MANVYRRKGLLFRVRDNEIVKATLAVLLIALPIILIVLPSDYFDNGQSISVFAWFGVEDYVYSTGITRAIMHLIHLDFASAWKYNELSFIVLPLIGLLWLKWVAWCFGKNILRFL